MSGFGVDPTQQGPDPQQQPGPQQAPDPSQVFADPSQLPAMQGGGASEEQEPGEPQQPLDIPAETLDVEANILEAMEAGCEMCIAATNVDAEDFMRFAQGVQFLSVAMQNLQPRPATDPAAAQLAGTALRVDQQHTATMLKAQKDLATIRAQHDQQQVDSAHQSVSSVPPPPPPRPAATPPSARG